MAKRTRAIGYVRVSTAEQTQGFGIDVQERSLRDYAKRSDVRIIRIERDEGLSGSNGLDSRPGLATALAKLEAGEADALLVYRLDRLARALVLQETIVGRMEKAGVTVVSVSEPDVDGSDPTRVLVRQVLGAISQYERAVIRSRMLLGKAAKKARGGYAGGRPAYGYAAQDGELAPNEGEQRAITLARRLHKKNLSLRKIAQELESQGYRPKCGGHWQPTQVARILGR